MGVGKFVREWREQFRFKALDPELRSVVFYAENEGSWKHFQPIVSELVERFGRSICYITSSADDPVLRLDNDRIKTFYIGLGSARTVLFVSLQADVMVMTMPDLQTYHIKRSKYPVHYVYVFHSLLSTHMMYRRDAFDHFDTIFCVGPHHVEEIRATESLYGLKPKILVEAGYGLLDSIINSSDSSSDPGQVPGDAGKRILIAPSYGPQGLLETCGHELVEVLLRAGHRVTVRPHIMTNRQNPKLLSDLGKQFRENPKFAMDLDMASQGTVHASDLMISDWSGAALEYAFGLERPVLYIDVPRKVNNPDYERIAPEPIDVTLREKLGALVAPDQLADVPRWIEELCGNASTWSGRIRELRAQWVYNVGNSGAVEASYIAKIAGPNGDPDL